MKVAGGPWCPVFVIGVWVAGVVGAATCALVQVCEVHVHQHAFDLALVRLPGAVHNESLTGRFRLDDDVDHLNGGTVDQWMWK